MPSVFLFSDVASAPYLSWAFRAPGNHLIVSLLAQTVTGASCVLFACLKDG